MNSLITANCNVPPPASVYIRLTVRDDTDTNEITIKCNTKGDIAGDHVIEGYRVTLIDMHDDNNIINITISRGVDWERLRDSMISVFQPIKTFEIYDLDTYRGDIFFDEINDIIRLLQLPKKHESMQRMGPNKSIFVAKSQTDRVIENIINRTTGRPSLNAGS